MRSKGNPVPRRLRRSRNSANSHLQISRSTVAFTRIPQFLQLLGGPNLPTFQGQSPLLTRFAKLATCQVPVHSEDAEVPKAKYKCPQCLIHYCSLACFKVHKESCLPVATKTEDPAEEREKAISDLSNKKETGASSPDKATKEYALLSAGQLSLLRKNPEVIQQMNSPTLKILLQNILSGIPKDIDLAEITTETAPSLEHALSLLHQVRTTESGPAVADLESLIDSIHTVSGEYHP